MDLQWHQARIQNEEQVTSLRDRGFLPFTYLDLTALSFLGTEVLPGESWASSQQ